MSPKNTLTAIAITLTTMSVGIHNPATALVKPPISVNETVTINLSNQRPKQPNVITQNDTYRGPDRDYTIKMPGTVTNNTNDQLTSVSSITNTVYTILSKYSEAATQLTPSQTRQVLHSSMLETIGRTGLVIRTNNYQIEGYPGLELTMQHADGTLGKYRAFAVNQRLYFMGAITTNKFTRESIDFFDSFRVYPEQIRYSNPGVY
ncbi:hypothetical protein [Nostoc sp. UHCC 0870]|uniref:hypothetical protein n=1 Tax=Nostoc sp. UHCC 0870 TaxID=2914041 RepID=UPI001EDCF057|nr:hypothetical protein [Nostoc sp. UHCC 0870]UKO97883.1 hypothetical protein L6494_25570 [Nostoc sp. UHCC 0870]